jgi:hypothetical protein
VKHLTLPRFWQHYRQLPQEVQELAKKNFELLKADPLHPSLHFKRVGKAKQLWSVRVGVLAKEKPEGMVWFWIGPHAEYDKILS